jgi:hypothetical protein
MPCAPAPRRLAHASRGRGRRRDGARAEPRDSATRDRRCHQTAALRDRRHCRRDCGSHHWRQRRAGIRLETASAMTATSVLISPKRKSSSRTCWLGTSASKKKPCRSVVQFQREAAGAHAAAAGAVRQAGRDTSRAAADLSGDARGNGPHDALARELLHEQVQEARFHRVQRRPHSHSLPPHRRRARLTC